MGVVNCDYAAAGEADFENIDKYGLDFDEYVKSALDCAVNGDGDKTVDLVNLPLDGSLPRGWYNIDTWKGRFSQSWTGRFVRVQTIEWEDF